MNAKEITAKIDSFTDVRYKIRILFDWADDKMLEGEFNEIQELTSCFEIDRCSDVTLLVNLATITDWCQDKIDRRDFLVRVRKRLTALAPDRVDKLLYGLERDNRKNFIADTAWLMDLHAVLEKDDEYDAIDCLYDTLERYVSNKTYDAYDWFLEHFPVESHRDVTVMLGIASRSFWSQDKLTKRDQYMSRLRKRLETDRCEDIESMLLGLEGPNTRENDWVKEFALTSDISKLRNP